MTAASPTARLVLTDVVLRDGLQDEPVLVPVADRLAVAPASFVNARRVPQVAGAEDLMVALPRFRCPVERPRAQREGVVRAVAAGVREIALVISASSAHSHANAGCTIDDTLADVASVVAANSAVTFTGGSPPRWSAPSTAKSPRRRCSRSPAASPRSTSSGSGSPTPSALPRATRLCAHSSCCAPNCPTWSSDSTCKRPRPGPPHRRRRSGLRDHPLRLRRGRPRGLPVRLWCSRQHRHRGPRRAPAHRRSAHRHRRGGARRRRRARRAGPRPRPGAELSSPRTRRPSSPAPTAAWAERPCPTRLARVPPRQRRRHPRQCGPS